MVRTLENELEFCCQMQIPPTSKIIAWIIGHGSALLNLDTVGSDGTVPFERWRGRGHHTAAKWNMGFIISTKTQRKAGRPAKRREDDLNE